MDMNETPAPTTLAEALDHPSWSHNDSLAMIVHHLNNLVDNGSLDPAVAATIIIKLPIAMTNPNLDSF